MTPTHAKDLPSPKPSKLADIDELEEPKQKTLTELRKSWLSEFSTSAPKASKSFLPAWRKKSLNEIERIKNRKQGGEQKRVLALTQNTS